MEGDELTEQQVEQCLKEAEDLAAMMRTPGWLWLERYLVDSANTAMRKGILTDDEKEWRKCKEFYSGVMTAIEEPKKFLEAARNHRQREAEGRETQA